MTRTFPATAARKDPCRSRGLMCAKQTTACRTLGSLVEGAVDREEETTDGLENGVQDSLENGKHVVLLMSECGRKSCIRPEMVLRAARCGSGNEYRSGHSDPTSHEQPIFHARDQRI